MKKNIFLSFYILLIFNVLSAQVDTAAISKEVDAILSERAKPIEKKSKIKMLTVTVGSRSAFYPLERYLDGTNKNYIRNINWIPMSFKFERLLGEHFSLGLTVNIVNNQRIYEADWNNLYKQFNGKHRFTIIQKRTSFLCRGNVFFIKKPMFELYGGMGMGLTYYDQRKVVEPYSYEYGGSGETDFLRIIGFEVSLGCRFYPTPKTHWGLMAEGGLMQSLGRVGISYRIFE
jgi:hypothetical protein